MWKYIVGGFIAASVLPAAVKVGLPAIWKAVRPKVRGVAGEGEVNRILGKFKGKEFTRARDVMIPVKGRPGKTSQIDNILISPQGVFLIETKNYAGTVIGDKESRNWTHISPGKYGNTREFYNPIRQNQGHIWALRDLLKDSYPGLKFHNVVVFSNECTPPKIDGVVTFRELRKYLKNEMKGQPVLTEKDVAAIKDVIEKNNIKDKRKRAEHVEGARYAAGLAKEQERQEIVRERAKENNDMALRVQALYSQGRASSFAVREAKELEAKKKRSLSDQIEDAAGQRKVGASVAQEEVKTKTVVREDSSEMSSLESQIQEADSQKMVGPSVEQVIKQDIFFEL